MLGRLSNTSVLALDKAGNARSWVSVESAIHLLTTGRVIAPLGEHAQVYRGGINRLSGERSSIEVSSILLTNARVVPRLWKRDYAPPLTNRALFARDDHHCQYCGEHHSVRHLTRDHIVPVSRGGADTWTNVTSACFDCNNRKGARTPQEWGVDLLSVPYTPCYTENLILQGRHVLADQAMFLRARVRRRHGS